MQVASRTPDEHLRVSITDRDGHWIEVTVVGPTRRVRLEVAGPGETIVVRGDLDTSEFVSQLSLLRQHGADPKVGIAGRFHVSAVDQSDKAGYVDWGNGGPTVWIYPNRRGAGTDWARFSATELLEDLVAIWGSHQPE